MSIKVLQVGLGPIGTAVVRQLISRTGLSVVGAIDIDPEKVGRDLGDICGASRLGIKVSNDLVGTIGAGRPDIAVMCTSSSLKRALPQFEVVLGHKLPIVSTTEELAYPAASHVIETNRLDQLARAAGVAVLGTGVNPGFAMDALPIALTGVCETLESIRVDRIQDARIRRLPFQKKIGAGLTLEEFSQRAGDGSVRHVGLAESIAMIADSFGWRLDKVTDEIQPKLADVAVSSEYLTVEPGLVSGIVQEGRGYRNGEVLITLHMEAYLGAPESYDAVHIFGNPPLIMRIAGGIHGDIATASIVVNSIPRVCQATPGLRTMRDMVLPGYYGG